MTRYNRATELWPARWVQVDCRPTFASFRNQAFFYDDVKIEFRDWSLNKDGYMYRWIVQHDDDAGWANVNLELIAT